MSGPGEDGLPSYEDVLKEEERLQQNQRPQHGQDLPPSYSRPPQRPPSDTKQRPTEPPRPSSKPSKLPSRPSVKPANTKPAKPAKPASKPTPSVQPKPSNIPWVYPKGYYCEKCRNTGYKIKNGKSCKRCWRQFATRNSATPMGGPTVVTTPNTYYSGLPFGDYLHPFSQPTYQYGAPPMQIGGQAPIYVRPGDPRLGGVVCGECRGTGRVRFFLDEDLCPLCNGVGRIVR